MKGDEEKEMMCWGHKGVFFGSDSDYWLRQNGDVSIGFTKDGGIEGKTEGGWR